VIATPDRHQRLVTVGPSADAQRAPAAALDSLADAMESERRVLDEIAATMRRQRAAVGADDLDTIDDTVFAMHRLLQTLGAARQRRRMVSQLFGASEDLPIRDLESLLGPLITARIAGARDALQQSARALSSEVQINRRVLREVMASGEDFVRTLAGVGDPGAHPSHYQATYAGAGTAPAATPRLGSGLLVNRTV
jgi:hypothetical protein